MIAPFDARAVRPLPDGALSLRPFVDFRAPGAEAPAPPVVPTTPLPAYEVREDEIPWFLQAGAC
jgi:hypothetical protein